MVDIFVGFGFSLAGALLFSSGDHTTGVGCFIVAALYNIAYEIRRGRK